MNLLSLSKRYAYVKAAIPRETFEALVAWFGTDGQALRTLRLDWERVIATWERDLKAPKADGSASVPDPRPRPPGASPGGND